MKPPVPFKWKGNHHSYYGAFMVAFGAFNWYMGVDNGALAALIPFWQTWIVAGSAFMIDDLIEHTITADTPLRIIYRFLYKLDE